MARKTTRTRQFHQQVQTSPTAAAEDDVTAPHAAHTPAEQPLHSRSVTRGEAAAEQKGNSRRTGGLKYSVLLPTYNEAENIALIVWLLIRTFEEWCAPYHA